MAIDELNPARARARNVRMLARAIEATLDPENVRQVNFKTTAQGAAGLIEVIDKRLLDIKNLLTHTQEDLLGFKEDLLRLQCLYVNQRLLLKQVEQCGV